jgi:hypothetical protein
MITPTRGVRAISRKAVHNRLAGGAWLSRLHHPANVCMKQTKRQDTRGKNKDFLMNRQERT